METTPNLGPRAVGWLNNFFKLIAIFPETLESFSFYAAILHLHERPAEYAVYFLLYLKCIAYKAFGDEMLFCLQMFAFAGGLGLPPRP
jgi:hypothetical protein